MDRIAIQKMIEKSRQIDIQSIKCKNPEIENILRIIYGFSQDLNEEYSKIIDKMLDSNVRFCDYYDGPNQKKRSN